MKNSDITVVLCQPAEIYRDRVARLHEALTDETTRTEATELPRGLVDRIVLHPGEHGPRSSWAGDIARMVEHIAQKQERRLRGGGVT